MTVRWRLTTAALQVVILLTVTWDVTGSLVTRHTWFLAGLLAIVINPQLLEPWYPRPQDVLANTVVAGILAALSSQSVARTGWIILGVFLSAFFLVSLAALLLGASRESGPGVEVGRAARGLSGTASALAIYSGVFWLSLIEYRPQFGPDFWLLGGTWLLIVVIGRVNWQGLLAGFTGAALPCVPEGMVGPQRLLLSSTSLPEVGLKVRLEDHRVKADGIITTRIRRARDVWAEVFVEDADRCDTLVQRPTLKLTVLDPKVQDRFAGSVDVGSTNQILRFVANVDLEIGTAVSVRGKGGDVLYQLSRAEVEEATVRGGSHLVVRATGTQLGSFDADAWRLRKHQWVPSPGAAVHTRVPGVDPDGAPAGWHHLGDAIGSSIPVFLEPDELRKGHLAMLGMTRMGKTTLAVSLAEVLSKTSRVTILDQTGEYVGKRGMEAYQPDHAHLDTGMSVFEPAVGKVAASEALSFLLGLLSAAEAEYAAGTPKPRVLIIDEAHQFIPEPAGLGFNAPGRDAAYQFGLLMMQVRKFGITMILISQRTAVVAKSALSQCETLIAFKNVDQTGLDYLEAILGTEARHMLPTLEQGQALVFGPAITSDAPVAIELVGPAEGES